MAELVIAIASVPVAFVAWFKDTVKTVFRSFLVILVGGFLLFTILFIVDRTAIDLWTLLVFVAPLYMSVMWLVLSLDVGYIASKYLNIQFKSIVIGWSVTLVAWLTIMFYHTLLWFTQTFFPSVGGNLYSTIRMELQVSMLVIVPWLLGLLIDRLSAQKINEN